MPFFAFTAALLLGACQPSKIFPTSENLSLRVDVHADPDQPYFTADEGQPSDAKIIEQVRRRPSGQFMEHITNLRRVSPREWKKSPFGFSRYDEKPQIAYYTDKSGIEVVFWFYGAWGETRQEADTRFEAPLEKNTQGSVGEFEYHVKWLPQ
jgi:hypothetical protein